jgi:hypothetical protein
MEKAFDRVSYEFTMKGLEALGFGNKFRSWVGQMYDVDNAPNDGSTSTDGTRNGSRSKAE